MIDKTKDIMIISSANPNSNEFQNCNFKIKYTILRDEKHFSRKMIKLSFNFWPYFGKWNNYYYIFIETLRNFYQEK